MPLPSQKQQTAIYRDYLSRPENYRVEPLDGAVFDMGPAPSRRHQQVLGELFKQIAVFLTGKPCKVYSALLTSVCPMKKKRTMRCEPLFNPISWWFAMKASWMSEVAGARRMLSWRSFHRLPLPEIRSIKSVFTKRPVCGNTGLFIPLTT